MLNYICEMNSLLFGNRRNVLCSLVEVREFVKQKEQTTVPKLADAQNWKK